MVLGLDEDDDADDTVDPSSPPPPSRNVIDVVDDDDFLVEDEELFARIRRARETTSPYSADVADDRDSGTRAQGQ